MYRPGADHGVNNLVQVYSELCTDQVLTTEYITGLTIDRCVELPQPTRDFIAESILKLVFRDKMYKIKFNLSKKKK